MADEPRLKNVDVLTQAEAALMGAVAAGTGVTLNGVRLYMGEVIANEWNSDVFTCMGHMHTAEISRTDEGALIPVNHTAEQVREWAEGVFTRLLSERKSFNDPKNNRVPTGGTDPSVMGGPVLAENLMRSYTAKHNSYWVGLMGGDIGAINKQNKSVRESARIAESGGWMIGGQFTADTGVEAPTGTFVSRKKALKAGVKAVFGKDWWKEDKEGRLSAFKEYVVNAANPAEVGYASAHKKATAAPAPVEAAPEAVQAEAPAAAATTKTINELRAIAKQLGLSAGGSKAAIQTRIDEFMASLGL